MSKKEKNKKQEQESVFAWKKNGFDVHEHLTLKNNALEAEVYQDSEQQRRPKRLKNNDKKLPLGLQKIRKKIREVYDEDDEEEDDYTYTFAHMPMVEPEEDDRLLKGLTDQEKRDLQQKETIDTMKSMQDAGRMEALHIAHNMARDIGLKGLEKKTVSESMQRAEFKPQEIQDLAIQKDIAARLGIKGKIDNGKVREAAKGIKKVENLGGQKATKNLDMKDMIKAGEEKLDEIRLAELILEKSGQDVKKRKVNLQKSKENIELKNLDQTKEKKNKEPKEVEKKKKSTLLRLDDDFSR
ncbi:MAG: hypothetical protein IKS23_03640 [Alphaproteobacteria bacterium]|nr:hypothetical protein [Alphaproteobacteria bacterium]